MHHDSATELLRAFSLVYTPLRRVGPRESPYPGVLVRTSGTVQLLVDAGAAPQATLFWSPMPDSHILRARDVTEGATGTQALVDACQEPVSEFIRRRGSLEPGEIATVALGILRGARELRENPLGRWWLTMSGRPVFALDDGDRPLLDETHDVLDAITTTDPEGVSLLAAVAALVAEGGRDALWDECDSALFAWTSPGPVHTSTGVPLTGAPRPKPARADPAVSARDSAEPGTLGRLLKVAHGDVGRTLSDAASALSARLRARHDVREDTDEPSASRGGRRRRVLFAAAACLVAVFVLSALWPAGGQGGTEQVTATATVAPETTPAPLALGDQERDLPALAGALLDARVSCASDTACLSTVMENAAALFPAGAIDAPAGARRLDLVEDFGDVAVVRVHADSAVADQLAILARHETGWVLRVVYDIAQHPAG